MSRRDAPLLALATALFFSALWACSPAGAGDKVLCERVSAFNTVIVTENASGVRTLRFEPNGARQSVMRLSDPDHLELPYTQAILAGMVYSDQPKRVLIVGLGGGTLPSFLRRHYPKLTIDAVDIDPEVVRAAKEFFAFREDDAMHAHVADGRKFIEEVRDPYDLVFLDAYGSDSIPMHLATLEFLRAVRRALKPDGACVGNVWGRGSNQHYDRMLRTYHEAFAEVDAIDVAGAGNMILIAMPRARQSTREEIARRATALGREKGWTFDLGKMVAADFENSQLDTHFEPIVDAELPKR